MNYVVKGNIYLTVATENSLIQWKNDQGQISNTMLFQEGVILVRSNHGGFIPAHTLRNQTVCESVRNYEEQAISYRHPVTSQKVLGGIILGTVPSQTPGMPFIDAKSLEEQSPKVLSKKQRRLIEQYYRK